MQFRSFLVFTLLYICVVLVSGLEIMKDVPKPFSTRLAEMRKASQTILATETHEVPQSKPVFKGYRSGPVRAPVYHDVPAMFIPSSGEQAITDHGDTFVTISLEIGDQHIKAIPDSGSFELYNVDGDDCDLDLCVPAYKPVRSPQHFQPSSTFAKEIYFGSGTCGVELSFDSVKVHNELALATSSSTVLVPLWRIVEMDDNLASVWGDGLGFQGIVGLGFKGNTNKGVSESLLEEKVVLEARTSTGLNPTRPGLASKALFGDVFAICLPRGEDAKPVDVLAQDASKSNGQGRLWWGASVPSTLSFIEAPVVGTRHWTIQVTAAYFQADGSDAGHHLCGTSAPGAALVDSGTSLIAMSEQKISQLLATTIVGSLNPDCSNVDQMPDLIFDIGNGQKLTLPPDTYIMKIRGEDLALLGNGRVVMEKGKVLNVNAPPKSMIALSGASRNAITYCTHAFMETPMETALVQGVEHELIILGIPIFREYTVKFDRNRETLGFALHPFGTTCEQVSSETSFAQVERSRSHPIRSLGSLRDLVFPDEFTLL